MKKGDAIKAGSAAAPSPRSRQPGWAGAGVDVFKNLHYCWGVGVFFPFFFFLIQLIQSVKIFTTSAPSQSPVGRPAPRGRPKAAAKRAGMLRGPRHGWLGAVPSLQASSQTQPPPPSGFAQDYQGQPDPQKSLSWVGSSRQWGEMLPPLPQGWKSRCRRGVVVTTNREGTELPRTLQHAPPATRPTSPCVIPVFFPGSARLQASPAAKVRCAPRWALYGEHRVRSGARAGVAEEIPEVRC